MLLARAARRRALEESRTPEVARNFGAPTTSPPISTEASKGDQELVRIQPLAISSDARIDTADSQPSGDEHDEARSSERISIEQVRHLQESGEPVLILDVRTERSLNTSDSQVKGAVRLIPEHVVEQARELNLPKDAWLIAYCA